MKSILLLMLSAIFAGPALAASETELEAGLVNPGYHEKPSWFKMSFLDLFADIDEAADNGKRVMVYFYQDGCPYCKILLQDNFGQKRIADKTQEYFDVVAINIWGDNEVTVGDKVFTEKTLAEALRVQYTPTLLFFNEDKKAVYRANGYYAPEKFTALLDYIGQRKEQQLDYQAYLQQVDPQPASGKLHTQHTSIDKPDDIEAALTAGRYLMVSFEQKQCAPCDELHLDILNRPESREQLERLDMATLDMWSDKKLKRPDGKTSTVRQWAKDLDIKYAPSLVFFNDQGEEVFRSEAYLKSFHIQSVMDYVASTAYMKQPNFQRFVDARADKLAEQGIEVNLME